MDKYLLLRYNGVAEFIDMPRGSRWLDAAYAAIGCDCIAIVETIYNHIVFVIDDCAKLCDCWEDYINTFASDLYPGSLYGDVIVGNVIVLQRVGCDFFPLDPIDYWRFLGNFPGPLLIK